MKKRPTDDPLYPLTDTEIDVFRNQQLTDEDIRRIAFERRGQVPGAQPRTVPAGLELSDAEAAVFRTQGLTDCDMREIDQTRRASR